MVQLYSTIALFADEDDHVVPMTSTDPATTVKTSLIRAGSEFGCYLLLRVSVGQNRRSKEVTYDFTMHTVIFYFRVKAWLIFFSNGMAVALPLH